MPLHLASQLRDTKVTSAERHRTVCFQCACRGDYSRACWPSRYAVD